MVVNADGSDARDGVCDVTTVAVVLRGAPVALKLRVVFGGTACMLGYKLGFVVPVCGVALADVGSIEGAREKFAHVKRVPFLEWSTIERLPKKAPMPGFVDSYKSMYLARVSYRSAPNARRSSR